MRSRAVLAIAAAAAIAAVQAVAAGPPPSRAGKIVFVAGSHVLVVNADGTGLRDLSRPSDEADGIAVSPDGTRIVVNFVLCCLVQMNGNGSGSVRVANTAENPAWAPDGKHLAYIDPPGSAGDVHVLSENGRTRRTLRVAANGVIGAGLAWSPDGARLAFITETGVGVVAAAGGPVTMPPAMSAADSVVGWSPDGTKIAFLRKRTLYVARVDGGSPTLVGRGQDGFSTPAWSPDGKRFLMTIGKPSQIHVVSADGTHDRRLTHSEWGDASSSPAWSPDGRSIVFQRGRLAGLGAGEDLWRMNADGTGKRPLTNAFELNGADVGAFDQRWVAWVPGRAAGGTSIRAPRTIPVRASRTATVPVVDSNVGADAGGLAVSAGCVVRSWDGGPVRVRGPRSGVTRWPCLGGVELASAGGRTAWIGSHSINDDSWQALFVTGPSGRRLVDNAYSYCCPGEESGGKVLDGPAGDGPLLVYNSWPFNDPTHDQLWRLDGTRKVLIRSGADAGVAAVDAGRIATLQADGTLTFLSASGAKLGILRLGKGVDEVRLDGPRVVLLRDRRIEVYDTTSGRRTQVRRTVTRPGVKTKLEDAEDGLVVYTAGLDVHVLRVSDGRDVVLGFADEASEAHAQLVPGGLYYAYNQAWTRRPGRLGFVSMQEIDRVLARRG